MDKVPILIEAYSREFIKGLFKNEKADVGSLVELKDGSQLMLCNLNQRIGFNETVFIIELLINIGVSFSSSICATYLYDKLKNENIKMTIKKIKIKQITKVEIYETLKKVNSV